MFRRIINTMSFRISVLLIFTVGLTICILYENWLIVIPLIFCWIKTLLSVNKLYKQTSQKVAFMLDAINNNDYAFKYATLGRSSSDKLISDSLNRITQILFQAKTEAIQKEKYYELIMNCVNTGIIVIDDNGYIFQTNNEALRLLGLTVLTHVKQLERIDENLALLIKNIRPGNKHQISFTNERGTIYPYVYQILI